VSSLGEFRDHCRRMAAAEHKPECPSLDPLKVRYVVPANDYTGPLWFGLQPIRPKCRGCLTDADRTLFAQMAGEIDDYLAPQVDLFGDVTTEPTTEDA
jgi:hypothetical protein